MLISKNHRTFLKRIDHPKWFWHRINDWAFGERYKFKDGAIAYLFDGEIVTIRKGADIIWRKE